MSIDRDKVTELLRNYPHYKFAVRNFETTGWVALTGTVWSDSPRGGGFGSKAPVKFASDSIQDVMDYNSYKKATDAVEGALETLTDDEQAIITLKWMHGLTLDQIEDRRHMGRGYAKQVHRKALKSLAICLRFVEVPEIEEVAESIAVSI